MTTQKHEGREGCSSLCLRAFVLSSVLLAAFAGDVAMAAFASPRLAWFLPALSRQPPILAIALLGSLFHFWEYTLTRFLNVLRLADNPPEKLLVHLVVFSGVRAIYRDCAGLFDRHRDR